MIDPLLIIGLILIKEHGSEYFPDFPVPCIHPVDFFLNVRPLGIHTGTEPLRDQRAHFVCQVTVRFPKGFLIPAGTVTIQFFAGTVPRLPVSMAARSFSGRTFNLKK